MGQEQPIITDVRKQFTDGGFEIVQAGVSPGSIGVKKANCVPGPFLAFCTFGWGAAFLVIWSYLLFLRAEREATPATSRHALAALLYSAALFCKEIAFSFPFLILAYAGIPPPTRVIATHPVGKIGHSFMVPHCQTCWASYLSCRLPEQARRPRQGIQL